MPNEDAFFFDGASAKRRAVRLSFDTDGLNIVEDGKPLAFWRFADLRLADAPKGAPLRISAVSAPELARLEIRDAGLAKAIALRCPDLKRRRLTGEVSTRRILFWSAAAAISLVLTVVYLVPAFADRLAPLVPIPLERRIGDAVDRQVRAVIGGETCGGENGAAALARLQEELAAAADLPMPIEIAVLSSSTPNAVALPGGRVYLFEGLLKLAENPDEVAGVLAHELGHVASRDGLRKLLQTSGSAFLLGLLFGDVTGGGVIVFGAQVLIDSRYSRQAETAADDFAADLMLALGRPPAALGAILDRLGAGIGNALAFISSHPVTAERMRVLEARKQPATGAPLLSAAEWTALKAICGADGDGDT
ncbi:MAG: M48 family metallopeptidase [Propylenella sp.]